MQQDRRRIATTTHERAPELSAITSVNDSTDPAPHEIPAAEQPDLAELAQLYAGVIMLGNGMAL